MGTDSKVEYQYPLRFVEMAIETEEELERFLALPYPHKIGMTMLPCEEKDVISFGKYPYYVE